MKFSKSELEIITAYCEKNYRHYPNVAGVGVGLKFVKNKISDEENPCIQFYVRKKTKSPNRKLPKFIYGRLKDGSIDFSKKIPTDVIHFDELSFTCKSGSKIRCLGNKGSITLIFKNKISSDNSTYYALTCAHVAGGINRILPASVLSTCCTTNPIFADAIVASSPRRNVLEYDIALVKLRSACTPQAELEINNSGTKIEGFLSSNKLNTNTKLNCVFPKSIRIKNTQIVGKLNNLSIPYGSKEYKVKNLFLIDKSPSKGDSGGLLYIGTKAAGILIAKGENEDGGRFGVIQSLDDAFKYLQTLASSAGSPIKCFI